MEQPTTPEKQQKTAAPLTPTTAESSKTIAISPAVSAAAIEKLCRFCYISRLDQPVYAPTKFELIADMHFAGLRDLCAQVSEAQLYECLSQVLSTANAEYLPRHDESLLVLAVYLTTTSDKKERGLMRTNFPLLVRNDNDLFIFTKFIRHVQRILHRNTSLSRTARKAVTEWYKAQPLDALLSMWVNSHGNGHAHRDLLFRCHFRDEDVDKDIEAALRLFRTPVRELLEWPEHLDAIEQHKRIITGIAQLRLAKSQATAIDVVKQLSLSFEHVPRQMLVEVELANQILPTMTYEELLECWPQFMRIYLKSKESQRKYEEHFFHIRKLRQANVEPIRLLLQSTRKGNAKKGGFRGLHRFQQANFMLKLYKYSFGLNKPLGVRMHITLNLEKLYLSKGLTGRWRCINYLDAVVALAFGYYKSEADVSVHFWHDMSGQLKQLPWNKQMTADTAKKYCVDQKVLKTRQSLLDIIKSAQNDAKHVYDLFLVVVPGATRGNPQQCSDSLCARLDRYRKERNPRAKIVILSLRQNHASMRYSKTRSENILELCSVSERTNRMINAFARDKFI